ncbi:MAG: hypothetical protein IPP32_12340 [Bacteroidetes bacterium]|nr:hypothetical protein [Bacteroidota bacterium]
MLRLDEIKLPDGSGEQMHFHSPDVEYVDPIEHVANAIFELSASLTTKLLLNSGLPYSPEILKGEALKFASRSLKKEMDLFFAATIPENLLSILTATKKNNQVKLLKGLSITQEQLYAFIFRAKTEFDFLFSTYTAEHLPNGLDPNELPVFIEVKGNEVNKIGQTNLSDGQLKQVMAHRNFVSAMFIDKGSTWHCFFFTFNSVRGKEAWKDGQAHYHYISDKFGIPRAKVVEEIKSGRYHLGNLPHINLNDDRYDKNKGKGTY